MAKVYRHPVDPEAYAAFSRRPVKVVTRERLGNKIQFTSLRVFTVDKSTMRMTDIRGDIDAYTVHNRLGNVLWPFCETLKYANLAELVAEVKARGLYVFDIWGYVPGSWSETEPWGEYEVGEEAARLMEEELGDRFLGYDNGEQDGRYVGGYAPMMCPASQDHQSHYLNFQRHFEKLSDAMRHRVIALCSLHFGHYFIRENDEVMLGAECAQALPNINLWYAFLRGAGRQYGVLWFGNSSVWNRWGYKNYSDACEGGVKTDWYECGPRYGTSLSLLRRSLYLHYAYNCDILGYESGLLYEKSKQAGDEPGDWQYNPERSPNLVVTPIGALQMDAVKFVEKHGYPGPMHLPVAVMLDFFAGYTPPRHLYKKSVCQTWGGLPYGEGDYETHALFDLIYPGYTDAGFFRDERGFLTATPYGDMFDVLLSDAAQEVLASYNRVVLSGRFGLGAEEFDKLRAFVEAGGALNVCLDVVEAALPRFKEEREDFLGFFGLKALGERQACADGAEILYKGRVRMEKAFELYDVGLAGDAEAVARMKDGRPVIYEAARGAGRVCAVAVPYGINRAPAFDLSGEGGAVTANEENRDLAVPFGLLETVKAYLGDCFDGEKLVDVGPGLSWTVNFSQDGGLLLTVTNNGNAARRFDIRLRERKLARVEEWSLGVADTADAGYYPYVFERGNAEGEGNYVIEPLDIRAFSLIVDGLTLEDKPQIAVPDKTGRKFLKLIAGSTIREEILKNPTLEEHFAGIKADARYFMEHEEKMLAYEAGFVKRRGLEIIVDFSSLMNHYPDISLLGNIKKQYSESIRAIEDALDKAALYGCKQAVIILHRNAENHITPEDADERFSQAIGTISELCRVRGIALYLQNGTPERHGFAMRRMVEWIDDHDLDVKIAWNPAHSLISGESFGEIAAQYGKRIAALLLSAPVKDIHGQCTDAHQPIHLSAFRWQIMDAAQALLEGVDFVALDAEYSCFDEVYRDMKSIGRG